MTKDRARTVNGQDHRRLMRWAIDCARRVLPLFEERHPDDDRPRKALEVGRAWVRNGIKVGAARSAALDAHAAARAAGHAVATAHVTRHASGAALYAAKAVAAEAADAEHAWQRRHLPPHLRAIGFPVRSGRAAK